MSVSSEVTRIEADRNTIRNTLLAWGLAQATDNLDDLADALMGIIIDLRQDARKEKNWAVADRIRDALKDAGIRFLGLETDYTDSDAGQLRTRVGAFLELMH